MNKLNLGLLVMLEKMSRWAICPRFRGRILRFLGARVGARVRIHEVFFVNFVQGFQNLEVGDDVYLAQGCLIDLTGRVRIGHRTAVSPHCTLLTHSDPNSIGGNRLAVHFLRKIGDITIGADCWIGAGAIILCGVSVGDLSVIGAGSVVTKDVPSGSVVCGVPARVIRHIEPLVTID